MIISTGMRTDIPAFYSKWFINRLHEGYVCVRNPYRPEQVTKYVLSPDVVDCITFCTKNPTPMLSHIDELSDYGQFWFVTITPYGKDIEPNVPPVSEVIESFKELSMAIGKNAVSWRYDPIFFCKGFDTNRHIEGFEKIAKELKGYTNSCVISFLDMYKKLERNAPDIYPPDIEKQKTLCRAFVKIGRENGITIKSCYENACLAECGVDVAGCQTKATIENAIGQNLNVPKKRNQRGSCNCLLGNDIGAYDSCGHLCKYCYANADKELVLENMKLHNPDSPFLIGNYRKGDVITQANQASNVELQMSLF